MISAQAQRGQLRAAIVRALKAYGIRSVLKSKIKGNSQSVTGNLLRSISSSKYLSSVRVQSNIDKQTGIISNVSITVAPPWGKYGQKLDADLGSSRFAQGQMIPDRGVIRAWMDRKGIFYDAEVKVRVKAKNTGKEYTYVYNGNNSSARNMIAYNIQQDIIQNNRLRTRYPYSFELEKELSKVFNVAITNWFEVIGVNLLFDLDIEIASRI